MTNSGIQVGIIEFSEPNEEKLKRIFQYSKSRSRSYAAGDLASGPIDILMVNIDADDAEGQRQEFLQKHPGTPVVTASVNQPANDSNHHIQGSLLSTRVLKVLEQVEVAEREVEAAPEAVEKNPVDEVAEREVEAGPQAVENNPADEVAEREVEAAPQAVENNPVDEVAEREVEAAPEAVEKNPVDEVAEREVEAVPQAVENNPADEAVELPPEAIEASQAGNGFDVLVVDDSPSMQKALEIELKQVPVSLNVDFADSGEQALECIQQKTYDFMFLDIMMPGIDGFETCTTIRKDPAMKKTPIIMLSAKTSPLDEVKGVMAGCTTYLTKPIVHDDFQKLIKRIMEWLENFQQKQ